MREKLVLNI